MHDYNKTPELVGSMRRIAQQQGFSKSCLDEVGRLLSILCGAKPSGKFAEVGTGLGVGTAWILSGMDEDSSLVTVDIDGRQVELVAEALRGLSNVQVLQGDWKCILAHGPFDFVFVDAGPAKRTEADILINAVNPHGLIILDDFTPEEYWPPEWAGKPDVVREKWLADPRLVCTEVRTSKQNAVLVARRV